MNFTHNENCPPNCTSIHAPDEESLEDLDNEELDDLNWWADNDSEDVDGAGQV